MIKQVIVMRRDLKMRRGKECSQSSHASQIWLLERMNESRRTGRPVQLSNVEAAWVDGSFTKIVVRVDSEAALLEIHNQARAAGLVSHVITDAGKTEFHGIPTVTCCAIGPDESEKIDPFTRGLELL